jgi:MFS family permease
LSDSPNTARWLTAEEKVRLLYELESEERLVTVPAASTGYAWLFNPSLWGFALVFFGLNTCTYSVSLWLPSALKSVSGYSNFVLGFLSAIPYLVATVLMAIIGEHSDRTLERRWHIALSAMIARALITAIFTGAIVSIIAFALALPRRLHGGAPWAGQHNDMRGNAPPPRSR